MSERSPTVTTSECLTERANRPRLYLSWLAAGFVASAGSLLGGDILRGGVSPNRRQADPSAGAVAQGTAQVRNNQRDALGRTSQALQAVRNLQAQARAGAGGAPNAGPDPNHPGLMLPNVPDGLGPGGLQIAAGATANGPLWQGANLPVQSGGGGRINVTVKQTAQQALLNWQTFNVGRNTSLHFDQSGGGDNVGQWIAFNKVNDPSGSPSQILGSISAPGQVYVINQNGIIFGAGSQINVHALVASSLPLNENLLSRGLLNNPDGQFLLSGLAQPAGSNGTPAFTPPPSNLPGGRIGDVTVQRGAVINVPTSAEHIGGRVVLAGPNVNNQGSISTPDGQTILAAGLQVGFAAHPSTDPSLRGLDPYVGAVVDPTSQLAPYAGTAINSGIIDAERGNVTITGKDVRQLGAIHSTTSVSLNGRIDLLADYDAVSNLEGNTSNTSSSGGVRNLSPYAFLPRSSGTVTLGPGSVMEILPEWSSTEKVVGSELALRSQINMQGQAVHIGRGAMVLAPNANVTINAGVWNFISGIGQRTNFIRTGGQIYIEPEAMINVAGSTDVPADLSQWIQTVQLRGAELADRPLQRGGILRGPSITVDLRKSGTYNGFAWVGTPLADLSGYLNIIERTVGELTTAGGTVNLNSGGSIVVQPGATIDVSGGWVNFSGGMVKTTRVLYAGHIFDIADALPDRLYEGIYTGQFQDAHPRWGITHTYTVPFMLGEHYEPPYQHGGIGGNIALATPSMALDGTLLGFTEAGPRQRSNPPKGSAFSVAFTSQEQNAATNFPTVSPTPPTVTFVDDPDQHVADPFALDADGKPLPLRADRVAHVELPAGLQERYGFSSVTVDNPDGDIRVPRGVALRAPAKGSIKFTAANIRVDGQLEAPGGTVDLTVFNISPTMVAAMRNDNTIPTPQPNPDRGVVTLGHESSISAAGLIVDDRFSTETAYTQPLVTNGGTVSIVGYSAYLQPGSRIDVSGGVAIGPTGRRTYGDAGSITIKAGNDPNLPSVLGAHLQLEALLHGFSGTTKGGSLTLQAPFIQIGGHPGHADTLWLKPDFFSEGGFSNFTLTGLGGAADEPDSYKPAVVIAPGTILEPEVKSHVAVTNRPGLGDDVWMMPVVKPEGLRPAVSLNFRAPGIRDDVSRILKVRGDIILADGSRISAGPLGTVTFSGDTATILGSVSAPGGIISIAGASAFPSLDTNPTNALPTVYIGAKARLSTAGTTLLTPDAFGRRIGTVLPGGTISVSGNIVAEAGSVMDVSGTHGILDLHPTVLGLDAYGRTLRGHQLVPFSSGVASPLYSLMTVPTRVDSNGGTIILKGSQELFVDSTLLGKAGGPTALGGNLLVSSGRFYLPGEEQKPDDINLSVKQSGASIPVPFWPSGVNGIGRPVLDVNGDPIKAMGYFAADSFARGGFDALQLGGNVEFTERVVIDAARALSVGSGGVIKANAAVELNAPYVALGKPFTPPFSPLDQKDPFTLGGLPYFFPATYGPGSLTVRADLIDFGNLSLQNIGAANFIARGGEIRGDGTLNVAGRIFMEAGQIYPATGVTFNIIASDYTEGGQTQPGSIVFRRSGTLPLPWSAGGQLNVYGSLIDQGGVLRAPMGGINLGWDGTGTAPKNPISGQNVAVTQSLTLRSGSITSVSGIDPLTGQGMLIPYGLVASGTSWIDPAGTDITAGGLPAKTVNLAGASVVTEQGSTIDLRGGGDLYAYRWIKGIGGTTDVLASNNSFAVVRGYYANYMPYAAFNNGPNSGNLSGDPGYVNGNLTVGDQVYLGASRYLPAGVYTLLPARYALLPGAVLVTPQSGGPIGTWTLPDGSNIVSGYRFNSLNGDRTVPELMSRFEVAPSSVVRQRSEYEDYFANTFLRERAIQLDATVPRLPNDAGRLVFQATQAMDLRGTVLAKPWADGRGASIDISSTSDILISDGVLNATPGTLVLQSSQLNSFGAESLLIGGLRQTTTAGTKVIVNTPNITVDNAGSTLSGPEIILTANKTLTLAPGAVIAQTGTLSGPAETLIFGDGTTADGTLLRVSSDFNAQSVRNGAVNSTTPNLIVGAGASIAGTSITLDSTYGMTLDPTAVLNGESISLSSGQVSLLLDNPGAPPVTAGLVLGGAALQSLQSAQALSLLSYTSLDVYGTGTVGGPAFASLALHAGQIRGFNNAGGTARFQAGDILLDNKANGTPVGVVSAPSGTLAFDASVIRLGANTLAIDQFSTVQLNASGGLIAQEKGRLSVGGAVAITAPLITGAAQADHAISAAGALTMAGSGTAAKVTPGLGAKLALSGSSVVAGTDIALPSGILSIGATAGPLDIGGRLIASGTSQRFFDLTRYTDAGEIRLSSATGNVTLLAGSVIDVSAQPGGGNAGTLAVSAPQGSFSLSGTLLGQAGAGGKSGSFLLDTGSLPSGTISSVTSTLATGGFTQSVSIRDRLDALVTVDGTVKARSFQLSADSGTINVTGFIDASGQTGGNIDLKAAGSLILSPTATLTAAGLVFDSAGKGGSITLESGVQTDGAIQAGTSLDIAAGSKIDLSVAAQTASSAGAGQFSGTLHLRAPQNATSTDLLMSPILGTVTGASSILAEGYRLFDLTGSGAITATVQNDVKNNGLLFGGNSDAISTRLLAGNATLASQLVVAPGAEIVNRTGNLTLGTTSSNASADWNLADYRFGSKLAPGVLTLRAAGNLTFYNALTDGFVPTAVNPSGPAYTHGLMAVNPLLPLNLQSWSYRLSAGADLSAADFHQVSPLGSLGANAGSLQLGKNGGTNVASGGANALTSAAIGSPSTSSYKYQVIRTGTGTIDIAAGRNIQLLNQFATIYTAGVAVPDVTSVSGGTFDVPIQSLTGLQGTLGAVQQNPAYPAQYGFAGGNVSLFAQQDIAHQTLNSLNQVIADSERQLPMNWLYRRGFVDPLTGEYGASRFGETASTTWWVDYQNFFEGIGALGGGNVSLVAGNNISNVDAVVPTNARSPKGAPDASRLVELGGGNLTVRAGQDIDGGVYYVERGAGSLFAGGSIHTNSTRSPSLTILAGQAPYGSEKWLPTTLFLGKSSFNVAARGDVLLGPAANPFLLPQGYNNTYWYKSYFSTYGADAGVNVSSLAGDVTLRTVTTLPDDGGVKSILLTWIEKELLLNTNPQTASFYQPWLRLSEASVTPFAQVAALMPPSLRVTAFSGDANIVGSLSLSPSATGTVDILASSAINALQPTGTTTGLVAGQTVTAWTSGRLNLSDANPLSIPGVATPFAYQNLVGTTNAARQTANNFLSFIDRLFNESGSTQGEFSVIQTKQALHAPGVLHLNDANPLRLYALGGDISGLTVFSPKAARILAGHDVTDIGLYLQNTRDSDVSVVSAGRDIVAYNANSALRVLSRSAGNATAVGENPLAGDIQVSGPGVLEVLAGRNVDLGISPIFSDGTGLGITSIGNARNPYLPFDGASIIVGAGIGGTGTLTEAGIDFDSFLSTILNGTDSARYLSELSAMQAANGATSTTPLDATSVQALPDEEKEKIGLDLFFLVLRDAGRDFNVAGSPGFGTYAAGTAAIDALFGSASSGKGDISVTSREIKTRSGGDIGIVAPSGKLTVGLNITSGQALDQGVLTEHGGNISIFTDGNVDVGTSRIFTLRGGNIMIWSSSGDIAAGASSKTVASAPPTRVLIDPQSGDVSTDLAGLATGGGIGVLATVAGVPPGDVDLIAPSGAIDAGDAGIRSAGNLNLAAPTVLNASNIQVSGSSSGAPAAPAVSAPNVGGLAAASNTAAGGSNAAAAAQKEATKATEKPAPTEEPASVVSVEVIGYGGGEGPASPEPAPAPPSATPIPPPDTPLPSPDDDDEERRRKRQNLQSPLPSLDPPPPTDIR